MVSVLASCALDRGCYPRSGLIQDHNIGIGCLSAKHTALRNQDNMSELGVMSICGLLF
jgi:hypothetical protein